MVTVEVDPARVESRLAAGVIACPCCGGVLGRWGHGRARRIAGLADPVRPRRARCRVCAVAHVLLPVTVLLRRAYAAEQIWVALTARASGWGHRRIGAELRVPATTVRGWLRRAADRLEALRNWFVGIAVTAGVAPQPHVFVSAAAKDGPHVLLAIGAIPTSTNTTASPGRAPPAWVTSTVGRE